MAVRSRRSACTTRCRTPRAPLLVAEPKAARPSFDALGGEDEGKGEAITQKKKAEKKDEAPAESGSTEA